MSVGIRKSRSSALGTARSRGDSPTGPHQAGPAQLECPVGPELGSVLMPSVGVVGRFSDASEPFIAHIKEQPLVQIPLEVAHGV